MRIPSVLVCGLVACSGHDAPVKPDAPAPDIDAAQPRSCQRFGPLVRKGTVGRANNLPLSASGVESDPWIARDGNRLRMWFTTASRTPPHDVRIASAESADGITWTNVNDSVLRPSPNTFDAVGVETAAVVRFGGEHKLYYTADNPPDGSNRFTIGLARSPDGTTWTKAGNAFPPELAWEKPYCEGTTCFGGTLEPSLVVEGDRLHMWYAALGAIGETPSYRIGHAVSTDGTTWTRTPDPVFTGGAPGSWDEVLVSHTNVVADPAGGYHLLYFGSSVADYMKCEQAGQGGECFLTPGALGHAFSTDGRAWVRNPNNPILTSKPGEFDAWMVGGPMALIEDGMLRLWYFGSPTATSLDLRIGYATAACE